MNRLLLSVALLASTSCMFAHKHHDLSKEELLVVAEEQDQVIDQKNQMLTELQNKLDTKNQIIEKQSAMVSWLEERLCHLKHVFHEEPGYLSLAQALKNLIS